MTLRSLAILRGRKKKENQKIIKTRIRIILEKAGSGEKGEKAASLFTTSRKGETNSKEGADSTR